MSQVNTLSPFLNGEQGMSIFNKISGPFYYFLDNIRVHKLNVKIEHFDFNHDNNDIIVVYRIGKRKLLNKLEIFQFEQEYFENISHFDQHRLTKFSTIQYLLHDLFPTHYCNKETFINYLRKMIKNECLF